MFGGISSIYYTLSLFHLLTQTFTLFYDAPMMIEDKGKEAWQAISGYNKRNIVENTMFRIKTIFGGKLKSIDIKNQKTEFTIKTSLLNKMSSLGMPDAYKMRQN